MLPRIRAFHKPTGRMARVISINFEAKTALLEFPSGIRNTYPLQNEVAVMFCTGMAYKLGADRSDPDTDTEWIHEGDIVQVRYEDEMTGEERFVFGVIEYENYSFGVNLPHFGSWIYDLNRFSENDDLLLVGNIWQPQTWKGFDDWEFKKLLPEWLKDVGVVDEIECVKLKMDIVSHEYERRGDPLSCIYGIPDDPRFIELKAELDRLEKKEG